MAHEPEDSEKEQRLYKDEDYRKYKVASYQLSEKRFNEIVPPMSGLFGGLGLLSNYEKFPKSIQPYLYWFAIFGLVLCSSLIAKGLYDLLVDR